MQRLSFRDITLTQFTLKYMSAKDLFKGPQSQTSMNVQSLRFNDMTLTKFTLLNTRQLKICLKVFYKKINRG